MESKITCLNKTEIPKTILNSVKFNHAHYTAIMSGAKEVE